GFTCPVVLGTFQGSRRSFRLRGFHPLWQSIPETVSTRKTICNSLSLMQSRQEKSHNTELATPARLTPIRFGLIRFRSPLLTESRLLSSPGGTEMVHFPPFALIRLCIH